MKKRKQYLKFDGLLYKGYGWSDKNYELFCDKLVELAESFGKDCGLACSFNAVTAEKLNKEQSQSVKAIKDLAKLEKSADSDWTDDAVEYLDKCRKAKKKKK